MSEIHPLAYVDPAAELGPDCRVGPFCYVGPEVVLGARCVLHPHATVMGPSKFGENNTFFPHCTIGADPQDLKYKGGPTRLIAGDRNTFRENVTVHRGTEVDRQSGGATHIGSNNLFMIGTHVAHDVEVGDHVILANNVLVAGHVRIESYVNVGGACAMHHFVTIGRYAFLGGMTRVTHDVAPYMKVVGYDQEVRGINRPGMLRWKLADESIEGVKRVWRMIFARRGNGGPVSTGATLEELQRDPLCQDEHVRYLVEFLRRKRSVGVYGRVREALRTDADADRAHFYQARRPEVRT